MITCKKLVGALNKLLQPEKFEDYCPNGLQVEGKDNIRKIITGVSICEDLIDKAIAKKADTIIVHHGLIWKQDDPRVVSIKKRRLKKLLDHNINLIAYHLPLDAHPKKLNREPFYIPGRAKKIKRIAWCSGGAYDYLNQAVNKNVDAFVTGEVAEKTYHEVRELGIHFYAAGHHATERYGIKALTDYLKKTLKLKAEFIDIDNPI